MARVAGRWSTRPNPKQIEQQTAQVLVEFRQKLEEAGLSVPPIPPVPTEYLALTTTNLTVRGVRGLTAEGKKLSGLLDPEKAEICYEENDPLGRQSFSIAHELGHYYLHLLLPRQQSQQPNLFESTAPEGEISGFFREQAEMPPTKFYRCSETEIGLPEEETKSAKIPLSDPITQARLSQIMRQKEWASRLEWEANTFASSLLMPKEWMKNLHAQYAEDLEAIAEVLGLTIGAVRYRLNKLNLRQDEDGGFSGKNRSRSKKNSPQQGTLL